MVYQLLNPCNQRKNGYFFMLVIMILIKSIKFRIFESRKFAPLLVLIGYLTLYKEDVNVDLS
jgi:hypothetical protein